MKKLFLITTGVFWITVIALVVVGFSAGKNEKREARDQAGGDESELIDGNSGIEGTSLSTDETLVPTLESTPQNEGENESGGATRKEESVAYTTEVRTVEKPRYLDTSIVAEHTTEKDCWIIVSGNVYDVTDYIPFHPGGTGAIIDVCGTDATEAFNTKGGKGDPHSSTAKTLLTRYLKGKIGDAWGTVKVTEKVQVPVQSTNGTVPTFTTPTKVGTEPSTVVSDIVLGDTVKTTTEVKVRDSASIQGLLLGTASQGMIGTVVGGPKANSGYTWFKITYSNGLTGWSAGDFLVRSTASTVTQSPNVVPGASMPPASPDVTAKTCSSFTYNAWGACESNGTKTRTVKSSSPSGCTGGSPVTSQSCTYTPPASGGGYTTSQVASHNSASDCWLIISGKVYNVTQYIPFHPGGQSAISNRCGTDATTLFTSDANGGHAHSNSAKNQLTTYLLGDLTTTTVPPTASTCSSFTYSAWGACQTNNTQTRTVNSSSPSGCTGGSPVTSQSCTYDSTTPPLTCSSFTYSSWGSCQSNNTQTRSVQSSSPSGCTGGSPVISQSCTYTPPASGGGYTTSQVASHNSASDCWLIISGKAYNVTQYIPFHPGGTSRITSRCGTDATTVFTTSGGGGHRHSSSATNMLTSYYVGDVTVAQTTCTSFTYSSWGACQADSTQTRTVQSSSPSGCTGGSPVTSQSCVYDPGAPVVTCTDFTYSAWGSCQSNNTQTRSVQSFLPSGCTGGNPVTSQSCTYTPPATSQTYTITVDSSGNFGQTSRALTVGDKITFSYTSSNSEAKVGFTPSTVSSFTLDEEKSTRTVTFGTAGSWTAKVGDKNGNTLTITVE